MLRKLNFWFSGLALALLLLPIGTLLAQNSTGEIDGTVADSSGAVIPGAVVKVFKMSTGQIVRTVKTNDKGDYSVPQLDVGTYKIQVSAPGFKTSDITGIDLHIADTLAVNAALAMGEVSDVVTVVANAAAPATETQEHSTVINTEELNELALSTRNFEQMAILQPGVAFNGADDMQVGSVNSTGSGANAHSLSINGMRPQQLSWTMDGADILNHGDNKQVSLFPSITAIREIKVIRNSYGAQYGGGGSAQVLVSTRGGGSSFHGNAFYITRPSALTAIPYSLATVKTRSPNVYNDFGWAVSGPVFIPKIYPRVRSKTYFFYANELRRNTLYPTQTINDYPAIAQANGYFMTPVCALYTYAANGNRSCPNANRAPYDPNSPYPLFPYNILGPGSPLTSFDPVAKEYLKDEVLPALNIAQPNVPPGLPPNPQGTSNELMQQVGAPQDETQTLARVDHQFSQRFSMFGRYIIDPIHQTIVCGLYTGDCIPGLAQSHVLQSGQSLALHGTWEATPTMVIDLGVSYGVYKVTSDPFGNAMAQNSPDIQVTLPFANQLGRVPGLQINNTAWDTVGPYLNHNVTAQAFVNATKQLHQHLLYFGFSWERFTGRINDGIDNAGHITFTPGGSTVTTANTPYPAPGAPATIAVGAFESSFAAFLEGTVTQFKQKSLDPISRPIMDLWESYLQDDWRILPRLTVNAGVRYSIYGQEVDGGDNLGGFQPEAYNPTLVPTVAVGGATICTTPTAANCSAATFNPNFNALNGIVQAGKGGNSPYGNKISNTPMLDFGPRFGFAWNVYGDGKTSLRGGYGVFFNQTTMNTIKSLVFGNAAYVREPNWSGGAISFANPGGGSATTTTITPSTGQARTWHMPYTQAYSLDLQTQIDKDTMIDVGYVGNVTQHLQGEEDLNQPLPGLFLQAGLTHGANGITSGTQTNGLNQIRPYLGWGALTYIDTRFFANYNGLQASILRSLGKNSKLVVNYTWSKAMTNSLAVNNSDPQNRYDLKSEWGPASTDRREIITSHYIYNVPFYRSQQGLVGKTLGGWELSGIIQIVSGLWTEVTQNTIDPAGLGLLAGGSNAETRLDMTGALGGNTATTNPTGNPNHGPRTETEWFDTSVFVQVPAGAFRPGNEKPASVLMPGYSSINADLFKNFELRDQMRLQFRLEAFNVFNHVSPSGVTMSKSSTNFGQVSSWHQMRFIQLGAKYFF